MSPIGGVVMSAFRRVLRRRAERETMLLVSRVIEDLFDDVVGRVVDTGDLVHRADALAARVQREAILRECRELSGVAVAVAPFWDEPSVESHAEMMDAVGCAAVCALVNALRGFGFAGACPDAVEFGGGPWHDFNAAYARVYAGVTRHSPRELELPSTR